MPKKLGFVVYVDVLGVSEGQDFYEAQFAGFSHAISTRFPTDYWSEYDLTIRGLSDSVFFILQIAEELPARDDEFMFDRVEDFFRGIGNLQMDCFEIGMPLRGGVSIGMTTVYPRQSIVSFIGGQAIVDAVRLEENLKMCGIAFAHKSALQLDLQNVYERYLKRLKRRGIIKSFDVPTADGLMESYCVSWPADYNTSDICTRFLLYMPEERNSRGCANMKIAMKYFGTSRFTRTRCERLEEED